MDLPARSHSATDLRTCSACGTAVHRSEVHKNRYAQYICKSCRSDGVRAVGRKKMRHFFSRAPVAAAAMLAVVAFLVLAIGILVAGSRFHAYSSGGMVDDIKAMVKSLNQLVHKK